MSGIENSGLGGLVGPLPSYAVLDQIVERYLERGETLEDLVATGFEAPLVRRVLQLVDDSEFQRRQTPPLA